MNDTHMDLSAESQPTTDWVDPEIVENHENGEEKPTEKETEKHGSETDGGEKKENGDQDQKKPDSAEQENKVKNGEPEQVKDGVQKRIDELTKKRREAERRAVELETELEMERRKRSVDGTQEHQKVISERPDAEDFDTLEEYEEALVDWKIDQRELVRIEAEKEVNRKNEGQKKADKFNEAIKSGTETYDDFDEVIRDKNLKFSQNMVDAALDTEEPKEIIYYLAKNPEESARIAGLSPLSAAREIGKIEVALSKAKEKDSGADLESMKKKTKATDPIKPLKGNDVIRKDPAKMTMKEYAAARDRGEI